MDPLKTLRRFVCNLLCITFIICFLLGCGREDKDVKILKKVSKEYVTTYDFSWGLKSLPGGKVVVLVEEIGKDYPLALSYPDYSIYVLYYTLAFCDHMVRSDLPSRLFYIKGYPVAFYSDRFPAMDKNKIPKSIYPSLDGGRLVDDGSAWYVFICKTTSKYKVLPNPNMELTQVLFERGLKDFSCN